MLVVRRLFELGLVAFLFVLGLFLWYGRDLPDVSAKMDELEPLRLIFLDRHGTQITLRGSPYGARAHWDELPPHLIKAIIATEDRRFFSHYGFDPRSIVRASINNILSLRLKEGGSTITQQLAKNLFLTPERTLKRKIQELLLSIALELRRDKEDIFTAYVNRAYFGAGAWGISSAARIYFDKEVADLDIYESALLAGLLRAPSRYSPTHSPQEAHLRAKRVLHNLVSVGVLSEDEAQFLAERALQTQKLQEKKRHFTAHYFIDWLLPELEFLLAEHLKGDDNKKRELVIETTLDLTWQEESAHKVTQLIAEHEEFAKVGQVAVVVSDYQGAVRIMVGGKDYLDNRFNRATQAYRQPGSAFKLFVYVAALEQGWSSDSWVIDEAIEIDGWSPRNFDDDFHGKVSLAQAFGRSLNTIAVRLSEDIGRQHVIDVALRFGIEGSLPDAPSIALGTANINLLSLTNAYAILANGGQSVTPYGINAIYDSQGEAIYRHKPYEQNSVIEEEFAVIMTAMMRYAMLYGTGRRALMTDGRFVAGKTGTSQNFRDAWFIGFSSSYVGGVWMGNDDESVMSDVTGGNLPAALWRDIMDDIHQDELLEPPHNFSRGDDYLVQFKKMAAFAHHEAENDETDESLEALLERLGLEE